MTIEIIDGDLLDAFEKGDVNIIGHVVNCQGVMGSGIAKLIKQKYPTVFEDYQETLQDFDAFQQDPLGHVEICYLDAYPKAVVNFYAQRYYGAGERHLNYGALANGFAWLSTKLDKQNVVGFPYKMGSDRAGGDWGIVLEMIEFFFKDSQVKIYRLNK